jgi:hypothetical protein
VSDAAGVGDGVGVRVGGRVGTVVVVAAGSGTVVFVGDDVGDAVSPLHATNRVRSSAVDNVVKRFLTPSC